MMAVGLSPSPPLYGNICHTSQDLIGHGIACELRSPKQLRLARLSQDTLPSPFPFLPLSYPVPSHHDYSTDPMLLCAAAVGGCVTAVYGNDFRPLQCGSVHLWADTVQLSYLTPDSVLRHDSSLSHAGSGWD